MIYVNPRRHYVIMYVEESQADRIVTQLMKLKYISHIQGSPYKNLKKVYEKKSTNYLKLRAQLTIFPTLL